MKRIARVLTATCLLLSAISFIAAPTAVAVSANPAPDCTAGTTCTATFAYTGDYYSWTAPAALTYTFKVWGAQGGNAQYNGTINTYGGKGGYATGTYNLTAGQIIYIYVGGQGTSSSNSAVNPSNSGGVTSPSQQLAGGWNGGGYGFDGNVTANRGAGGGGASDIRIGGNTLTDRVIVAGAGAGGVSYANYGTNYPGVGGGTSGGDGYTANYDATRTYNGKGGTQSAGGLGGANGSSGSQGQLGTGGFPSYAYGYGEAGGGGGYYGGGASGTGMGGGGGSGYIGGVIGGSMIAGNASMPDPVSGNTTGRSGNGVITITYLNAPTPTTFTTAQLTPTNTNSSISYAITFSQNVNTVANSDFSNAGTATGCSFSISASSGTSFTLTVSSCGEGTLIPQVISGSVYGTVTSAYGPSGNALTTTPITIDRTAPTISSVSAPINATHKPSDTPTFTMVFSESVTITGTPRLTLTVGSSTEYANYVSMTDSKTALFRYTVATDPIEFDSDGIAVATSLGLNGGSIADLATNALAVFTFSAPTLTSVLVAQPAAAPTIDSIVATSGTLAIYFTPGAARGSTTSNYQYSTNNGGAWTTRSPVATTSPLTITGLTDGTGYTVRLKAITNAGNSDSSTAVTETPTAITVTGNATLTLTYGNSASTSAYVGGGGSGSYTWSLGSSISGVTLSGTTVTASNSLGAGTYTQTVRATDASTSQVGSKTLTITVNKASTSISIALPGSATNAAASGTVTITATVPRAGSVNFQLGGATISGCGSASAASTTATCSWTAPGSLGNVTLTAVFTPTDSSNYETSTTTNLVISVVNGVSTISLSLAGGVTQTPKGQNIVITAAIDQAGKITFYVDGKKLPGCINLSASAGNKTCTWKPAVQKQVAIKATLAPTNSVYQASSSTISVWVIRRTGTR